jgi:hypothetical protein
LQHSHAALEAGQHSRRRRLLIALCMIIAALAAIALKILQA